MIMVKCPECGDEIEYLRREIHTINDIEEIDSDGNMELVDSVIVASANQITDWCCPNCWERIASTNEEAKKFLHDTELEYAVKEANNGQTSKEG